MPSEQKLKGGWNQVSGAIKEKYGEFTDDELRQAQGSFQKLVGLIQERTGQAWEQIEAYVQDAYESAGMQVSRLSNTTSDYFQSTGDVVQRGYEQTTETISKHPAESIIAALAIGLIGGVMIGISIGEARRPQPTWRNGWQS